MTMTSIHRIPIEGSDTLHTIVNSELSLKGDADRSVHTMLIELSDFSSDATHLSCCLDWAMQIRDTMGISWGEAIDAAMTLYFG